MSLELMDINKIGLNDSQHDALQETINGLNFMALNIERHNLQVISRLIRAVMVDIVSWSKHRQMYNNNEPNLAENYLIDTSMITAFEFLAKFASMKDVELKNEILTMLQKAEVMRNSQQTIN